MAALLPFGKVADFLGELLPLPDQTTASRVRKWTMKAGQTASEEGANCKSLTGK
jgi:hypothetical protein